LVSIKPKEERVQKIREKKAFIAAKLEKSIEKELVDRLTKVYLILCCVGSFMLTRSCVNRVTMTRKKEASMFMRIRSRKLSSSSNVYQMTRKRTMMRTKMRRKKKRKMRKRKRKKKRKETTRLSLWKMSL